MKKAIAFAVLVLMITGCDSGSAPATTTSPNSNSQSSSSTTPSAAATTSTVASASATSGSPVSSPSMITSHYVYVASPPQNSIYSFSIDPDSGSLTPLAQTHTCTNPQAMVVDPVNPIIFLLCLNDPMVHVFSIASTGLLTEISDAAYANYIDFHAGLTSNFSYRKTLGISPDGSKLGVGGLYSTDALGHPIDWFNSMTVAPTTYYLHLYFMGSSHDSDIIFPNANQTQQGHFIYSINVNPPSDDGIYLSSDSNPTQNLNQTSFYPSAIVSY